MVLENLIPAKDALILWKPRKHQEDFKLVIVNQKTHDQEKHKHLSMSSGCAYSEWKTLSEVHMFSECMRILFSERVTNKEKVKEAIFEFGKIREMVTMRTLYHTLYYVDIMPREALESSIYGWDFNKKD